MKKTLLIAGFLFTALLAALIVYVEVFADRTRHFDKPLASVVPDKVEGWEVKDLPLAATEGLLEQVNKVLRFDDSVQRVYRKGDLEVIIYAAYWSPGKVTTADAGTHNPDSCWVAAGMKRSEGLYSQPGMASGRELLPYEYGVYSKDRYRTSVMFWHLVQGEPQHYEAQQEGWRNGITGRLERLPLVLSDMKKYGLNQKREQLFIRISSNKPIPSLMDDPAFDNLLRSVSGLGIFKDSAWR